MIKDHRPYYLKKIHFKAQNLYVERFLKPHFASLGSGYHFIRPWNVKVFGHPITVGKFVHIIGAKDNKTKLVIWAAEKDAGKITIGNYCLISPGVRITSAAEICIGDNCMLANGVYISDADWHGIYDRLESIGETAPVVLKENVWVGDSAIICKGVTIGENSIIGAGSIVTRDVPANCVAAGNPARVVKQLDPTHNLVKREKMFESPERLSAYMDSFDKEFLKDNTTIGWLRTLLFPRKGD